MTPGQEKIRDELRLLNERRTYFLLSAAGACLGFSVTQMNNLEPSPVIWFLVVSLVFTSVSILAGLRAISREALFLSANRLYLELVDELRGTDIGPDQIMGVAKSSFDALNNGQTFWKKMQTVTLLIGAVMLPIWKLIECDGCIAAILGPFRPGG